MSLSLALGSHAANRFARGMDADLGAVKHLNAQNVKGMRRTRADDFREAGNADAHQLALFAFFLLLFAQRV